MKIQHIKAKYLGAGYKIKTKDSKLVKIKLIKKTPGKLNLYSIIFETGTETVLTENETLPISFEVEKST